LISNKIIGKAGFQVSFHTNIRGNNLEALITCFVKVVMLKDLFWKIN